MICIQKDQITIKQNHITNHLAESHLPPCPKAWKMSRLLIFKNLLNLYAIHLAIQPSLWIFHALLWNVIKIGMDLWRRRGKLFQRVGAAETEKGYLNCLSKGTWSTSTLLNLTNITICLRLNFHLSFCFHFC